MGLKQWFEEKPPIHERLDNSSELFALAPWRKFPKLKIFGWVVLVTQLECLIVVPISFSRDPRTAAMVNMKDQLDADGNEVYPVPGYFVLTAIPLILLSWCLKDFVDAVWCLGQIFLGQGVVQGIDCFLLGLLKFGIASLSILTAIIYSLSRPAVWEIIVESVTVLLILDIDEKAYVTAKAIAPNAIAALETWAAGQDEKLEQERSMKNMTAKPAATSAPAQTEVEVREA
jgi:hypothetical protein